jgi:hypothetical protein
MGWEWRVFVPAPSAAAAAGLARLLRDAALGGARGAADAAEPPHEARSDVYLLGVGAAVGIKRRGEGEDDCGDAVAADGAGAATSAGAGAGAAGRCAAPASSLAPLNLEAKLEVERDAASGAVRLSKRAAATLLVRKRRWNGDAGEVALAFCRQLWRFR